MLFKYPELLWALFLLLVPLFIHLFQLRKFKKTPFTNVKLLQRIQIKSRKARNLKKWLLLFTRLLLFSTIIIAFAQPFFTKKNALKKRESVIYLDNSFSLQAKKNGNTLLHNAVQELLKNSKKENKINLFTNTDIYKNTSIKDIQNKILALEYNNKQLQLNEIALKANTLFSNKNETEKHLIIISDFQKSMINKNIDSTPSFTTHFIKLNPDNTNNISIDSTFISNVTAESIELTTTLTNNNKLDNIPVSLYNNNRLFAKTSAVFIGEEKKASVIFTLPKNVTFNGKIEIYDTNLEYDNRLYFSISKKEKIKVLVISESDSNYLNRIFTEDEFLIQTVSSNKINYSELENQNLIVLNELTTISESLKNSIQSFTTNGGNLIIIPSANSNVISYNKLLKSYATTIIDKTNIERKITNITFSNPLYKNVFKKNVSNFQYPTVQNHYRIKTIAPKILTFEDNSPFLTGTNGVYFFTTALSDNNSNFKNSPLIVPTMYNMGLNSLKFPKLYNTIGEASTIDVPITQENDNILKVLKNTIEFIPIQYSYPKKTTLIFNENPDKDGIYSITKENIPLTNISFNYARRESKLTYVDINSINIGTKNESITKLFHNLENTQKVSELWKWFVIFALVFLVLEVLIQKYLK